MLRFRLPIEIQFLSICVGLLAIVAPSYADDTKALNIDKPIPLIVSTPASGSWYEKHPFDPSMFGKTRGFAPPSQATTYSVMVYSDGMDAKRLNWLTRIDTILDEAHASDESYVSIFEGKGAQVGGYSASELHEMILDYGMRAEELKLKKLSLGIAASTDAGLKKTVGLADPIDFVVVVMRPASEAELKSEKRPRAKVAKIIPLDSREIEDGMFIRHVRAIADLLKKESSK